MAMTFKVRRGVKAGEAVAVVYISGPAILSTEVIQGNPSISVFRRGERNRGATIEVWRDYLKITTSKMI